MTQQGKFPHSTCLPACVFLQMPGPSPGHSHQALTQLPVLEGHSELSVVALVAMLYDSWRRCFKALTYDEWFGESAFLFTPKVTSTGNRGWRPNIKKYGAYPVLWWRVPRNLKKFKDYLYGSKFTVFTDNNPLTYVLSTAKLDATGHRWLAALAIFDFGIKYKPGVSNVDADSLSRLPHSPEAPRSKEAT